MSGLAESGLELEMVLGQRFQLRGRWRGRGSSRQSTVPREKGSSPGGAAAGPWVRREETQDPGRPGPRRVQKGAEEDVKSRLFE